MWQWVCPTLVVKVPRLLTCVSWFFSSLLIENKLWRMLRSLLESSRSHIWKYEKVGWLVRVLNHPSLKQSRCSPPPQSWEYHSPWGEWRAGTIYLGNKTVSWSDWQQSWALSITSWWQWTWVASFKENRRHTRRPNEDLFYTKLLAYKA